MLISFIGNLLMLAVDVVVTLLVLNYIMVAYFYVMYFCKANKINVRLLLEMLIPFNVMFTFLVMFLCKREEQ
jgi:hypothetical protein